MTLERVKWFAFASVHQDYGRYELTVRDFMTLGVPEANRTEERFAYALRFAEADSFVADLPDGLVRCSVLIGVEASCRVDNGNASRSLVLFSRTRQYGSWRSQQVPLMLLQSIEFSTGLQKKRNDELSS